MQGIGYRICERSEWNLCPIPCTGFQPHRGSHYSRSDMTGMGTRKDEAHTLCTYRVLQEKVKRFRSHIGEYKKRIIYMSQTYHLYEPDVAFFRAQMPAEAHTLAARTRSDGARGGVAWASAWKPGAVGIGYRIWERSEQILYPTHSVHRAHEKR